MDEFKINILAYSTKNGNFVQIANNLEDINI